MFARSKRIRSIIVTTITIALPAIGAQAQNRHLTAREVIARIQQQVGVPWQSDTVDTFKAGNPDSPVSGIAVTMMATLDVLQRAAAAGGNLIITGAADKAVNLVGCKSPHHQLPGIRWLADPMHAEATKHVLLGCQSLGCPAAISRSGGNDRGGEQTWGPEHKEMAAVSKKRSVMKSFRREYAGSRPG
jgi:hypothetical protein